MALLEFLNCLHFAILNSEYTSILLKPKQVLCLEAAYCGKDVLAVLPTGYGKSVVFHLLSSLLAEKKKQSGLPQKTVVLVIFPLNSLIQDQLQRINKGIERAVVLKRYTGEESNDNHETDQLDLRDVDESRLRRADYNYIFAHPETCLSTKQVVRLFQSEAYKTHVAAVVVDEAHCILEW